MKIKADQLLAKLNHLLIKLIGHLIIQSDYFIFIYQVIKIYGLCPTLANTKNRKKS